MHVCTTSRYSKRNRSVAFFSFNSNHRPNGYWYVISNTFYASSGTSVRAIFSQTKQLVVQHVSPRTFKHKINSPRHNSNITDRHGAGNAIPIFLFVFLYNLKIKSPVVCFRLKVINKRVRVWRRSTLSRVPRRHIDNTPYVPAKAFDPESKKREKHKHPRTYYYLYEHFSRVSRCGRLRRGVK